MSPDKIQESASTVLTHYLDEHRMRKTPERYAILDRILDLPGHFTLQDLSSALNQTGYHVSRSTIFNTISLLIGAGLIRRHTFTTDSTVYEPVIGSSPHHHLICSQCGKVREVKDAELDKYLLTKRFGKFLPTYSDINIYGLCAACQRKAKKPQRKSITNKA